MSAQTEPSWLTASDGYELALVGGKLAARNAKGRVLSAVPAKLKDSEEAMSLRALQQWLTRHHRDCLSTIEGWMLRSLPIPGPLVSSVWADPAWRTPLQDLVVAPLDSAGEAVWSSAGLLRAATDDGVKVVDLDGDTRLVADGSFVAAHPILLDELADWQELAVDLDVSQGVDQLWRTTFTRPDDGAGTPDGDARSVEDYSGGNFDELRHVLSRCRTLGFSVKGGFAVVPVWESGRLVEASYWVGSDDPEYPTVTGSLVWSEHNGPTLPLHQVGVVAYSEGVRMASMVYAGRKAEANA